MPPKPRASVGVDVCVKILDQENTEYKVHLEVPREDITKLKGYVSHYVNMATMFPQLIRALISKWK